MSAEQYVTNKGTGNRIGKATNTSTDGDAKQFMGQGGGDNAIEAVENKGKDTSTQIITQLDDSKEVASQIDAAVKRKNME